MDLKEKNIEAAIFDLDGTIADSLDIWSDIDTEFFAMFGLELPDDYQDAVKTMDFKAAAKYTKELLGLSWTEEEIIEKWNLMCRDEYAHNIPLKDGAEEYIKELSLRGVKLGLATASGPELFGPLLRRHGIYDCFETFVTTTQAGKDKNSPDVYLLCAEKLSCKPERCMVFEDILPGVLSAKSAGMTVTAVLDSHSLKDRQQIVAAADFCIVNFEDALRRRLAFPPES